MSTVNNIWANFHVNVIISNIFTLCSPNDQACIFRFLQCLIWLSREVPSNFVCGLKFRLQKRWGCCGRPLVTLPCNSTNVYRWYKHYKEGRERVDDLERSGRPSTSTDDQHVNKVKELVSRLLKTLQIWSEYQKNLWKPFWNSIWVYEKSNLVWYQKRSISWKKSRRVDVGETMLSDYQDKLKCIITGNETWIHAYDPETTDKSSKYRAKGEARPKRARQSRSKIMIVFFDFRGVVHYEFLSPRQTVNKEYYLSVMRRLR